MTLIGQASGTPRGDSLEKLTITYWKGGRTRTPIEALFNPTDISRSRSVEWEGPVGGLAGTVPGRRQQFLAVAPETLSVSLLFDTYESRGYTDSRVVGSLPNPGGANAFASDVTRLTDEVVALAEIDAGTGRPPVCLISWGQYAHIFTGVLVQLDQRFTMFLPDGTPVRATLECRFTEYRPPAPTQAGESLPAGAPTSRVLRRGDTLHDIAAQEYGDPGRWREIARANKITNPMRVGPGTVLTIPRLGG